MKATPSRARAAILANEIGIHDDAWSQDAQPEWDWNGWGTQSSWSTRDDAWNARPTWSSQECDSYDQWWAWRQPSPPEPKERNSQEILSLLHRGHTVDRLTSEELMEIVGAIDSQRRQKDADKDKATTPRSVKRKAVTPRRSARKTPQQSPPKGGDTKQSEKDEDAKQSPPKGGDAKQPEKGEDAKQSARKDGDTKQSEKDEDAKQSPKGGKKQTPKRAKHEPKDGDSNQAPEGETGHGATGAEDPNSEDAKKKEKEKRKKKMHARYMRFHRSLVSPNTPPEILKLAEKAAPHSPERSYLYESWLTSNECWKSSRLLISLRQKNSTKNRGVRRWMTFAEMCNKYGESIATEIRDAKLEDAELKKKEVRDHPECKHRKDMTQYLCLDDDCEEKEDLEEMEKLFQAEEGSNDSSDDSSDSSGHEAASSSKKPSKKDKKKKKKKSKKSKTKKASKEKAKTKKPGKNKGKTTGQDV
ncbi:unnamed protein product [Symbiodinium sp. CCMP2592]|nr:unnamed protein product [Symbiodinium sp. CCMP2592]